MSKRHKIVAILLVLCMCVSVYPETVMAQSMEDVNDRTEVQAEAAGDTVQDGETQETLPEEVQGEKEGSDESKSGEQVDAVDVAPNTADEESESELTEAEDDPEAVMAEDDDPGQGRLSGEVPSEFYDEPGRMRSMSTGLTHDSRFNGYSKLSGIDVSKWNKTIDWSKVKAAGIDFAFVRTCYRGYEGGGLAKDEYGPTNLKNAASAGVKVGAYIFSQAISVKEAEAEADYLLATVKGYNITMPLVFDFEYYPGGRLEKKNLSKTAQTNICLAFCKKIKAAGYTPLVYANKSMLTSDLNAAQISASYPIWLAHYTTKTNYTGDYDFWQYSSTGKVSGISGNVDMNVWYLKPGASGSFNSASGSTSSSGSKVTAPASTTLSGKASSYDKVKLSWKKVSGASGYRVYRYDSSSKSYKNIKTISGAGTTSYTDSGRSMGKTYKYRVKAYKKAGGQTAYSKASNTVSVKTDSTMTGKTNGTSIIVRKGPSTSKGKLTTLKINTGVTITGTSGSWYKISIKVKGKKKTGYIKKTYVTIIRKPTLKASAASTSKIKLTWSQSSGASGYQIQRYHSSKKKYVTVKTIKKGSTTSYTNGGLKKNTTYKYRIRAYKTVRGKKIYSYYCSAKSAKTKK